jgi:hypothetical protein
VTGISASCWATSKLGMDIYGMRDALATKGVRYVDAQDAEAL